MSQRELIKKINNFCNHFDYEYALNCGGCCYVAAVIAEMLDFKNIKYKVRYYECPTHYVIEVNKVPLNLGEFKGKYNYLEGCDHWDLYEYYYNNDWNDMYPTKLNGVVKMSIRNIFKNYKGCKRG